MTASTPCRIAAVVLAAGRSSRMGANKLVLELDGKPVIRHALDAITASRIDKTLVVLGHEAEQVRMAAGTQAAFVINPDFAAGMSTSLKAGLAALPPDVDGAMIFLGDMPDIEPVLIDRMIAAFDPTRGRDLVVPLRHGRRGHPVLWGRAFFPLLLREMQGDSGARDLIAGHAERLVEIEAPNDGVLLDLDTPAALLRRRQAGEPA